MKKIANFVIDEKFIDWQIDFQDLTKDICQHDYYFVGDKNFRFIKNKERVKRIKESDVLDTIINYDAIFLHSLFGLPFNLIPKIDKSVKVFWFAWGYDIYNNPTPKPLVNINLYHPLTKRYIRSDLKGLIFRFLMQTRDLLKKRGWNYYIRAINRVDFFSGIIPEEYDLVKQFYPTFSAQQTDYSYCNVNHFSQIEKINDNISHGEDIIIGNSTAYTNNHLDIFESLKNIDVEYKKIFVPLSYSPNPRYVKKIEDKGMELFGNSFIALTDFLPIDKYSDVINRCGICIYGMERQQGMGGIYLNLCNGCKVFLYETSVIYKFCKKIGVKVFSIEKDLNKNNSLEPLSNEVALNNRRIIFEKTSRDYMINKLNNIYNLI